MSYVDNNLLPGETVLCRGRLSWVIYVKSAVVVVFGLLLLYPWSPHLPNTWIFGCGAVVVGLLSAIPSLLYAWSTELVVTSLRIIAKRGLIRRRSFEMLHKKVESIEVQQGLAGRMLGYGTVVLHGTGGGIEAIPTIRRPLQFRNTAMAAQSGLPAAG